MIAKFAVISIALTLCFSSPLMAKDHANKGNKINSNKQSSPYSTRGKERADKRHELKKHKQYEKSLRKSVVNTAMTISLIAGIMMTDKNAIADNTSKSVMAWIAALIGIPIRKIRSMSLSTVM